MKYGIICAMQEEIALLAEDVAVQKSETVAGRNFIEGSLYGKQAVLVKSRIGKVASALTATAMIERFHPDCIIFCGTAGGVDKRLKVGDIVIADRLVQHDFFDGINYFRIPLIDRLYFEADRKLSEELRQGIETYLAGGDWGIPQQYLDEFGIDAPKAAVGTIASGDQFICTAEKNQWLAEHIPNLQCVEMEGASVAQVCYEYDIPFAAVRVISDSANDSSNVDFERFVREAACHFTRGGIRAFLQNV